ncbi:MAG: GNAT family N-acetyltransferase [Candidatus Heimdallarchaeota archaeon]|nr:MAG: GNAT family N-acetyltransferase [Candidatus Heimdallarchaeota archaeon]
MEFRQATEKDQSVLKKIKRYAFSRENRYDEPETSSPSTEPYPLRDYVVEDQSKIVAVIGVIDFSQRVRGVFVKMAGMSAVACRPEYRRQGYIAKLFQFVFEELHQQEYLVSTLYPFNFNFYERLGYGQADSIHVYTVKTSDIIQRPTPNRIIMEDFDPNYERCQPLYERLSLQLDGLAKRPDHVWKYLRGWDWTKHGFQFICQDLDGNDLGYLILRFEQKTQTKPFSYLEVREMVFFDSETKQAFLNFLANHDSQRKYVKFAPFDRNYLPFLKSPRIKENQIVANSMFRIINVEQLLPKLTYSKDVNAQITIDIQEYLNLCPWNNRQFTLEVSNGKGNITSSGSEIIVQLGIKEFSQIVIGFHTPHEFAEVGKIKGSSLAYDTLASIFPKQTTSLREYF